MALYTKESVERVKEAVDMVSLVGEKVDLRRSGIRFTGLCPFHDERTPSFSVNPELKLYNCFGCGEGGDAIKFLRETEGLDFREAIERLAEKTGVELKLEKEDPEAEERRRRQDRLRALLERAAGYFARYLWEGKEAEHARTYLEGRGLTEEVLREYRVGYAPAAGNKLVAQAQQAGLSQAEITGAGLARPGRGGLEDRFRGRIIFPLSDARGRVVGFAGRALQEGQRPKYLNTSENELFHKGKLLYGLDRARPAATKAGRVIVVEGYTDVLGLNQAGIPESVAIMGTSLTDDQIVELTRIGGTVFLALDADSAGQKATSRAAGLARDRGAELRVIPMPAGRDPADVVTGEGAEAFSALLEAAVSVPHFQLARTLDAAAGTVAGRDGAFSEAIPILRDPQVGIAEREELVRMTANALGLDLAVVHEAVKNAPRTPPPAGGDAPTTPPPAPPPRPVAAVERAERVFLSMCLAQPDVGRDYLSKLTDDHFSAPALRKVRDHLLANPVDPVAALTPGDEDLSTAVMDVTRLADEGPVSEQAIRLSYLQLELRRVDRDLRSAEQRADYERQRDLWSVRENVRGEIDELMGQAA